MAARQRCPLARPNAHSNANSNAHANPDSDTNTSSDCHSDAHSYAFQNKAPEADLKLLQELSSALQTWQPAGGAP